MIRGMRRARPATVLIRAYGVCMFIIAQPQKNRSSRRYIESLMTGNAADHMFTMDTFFHKAAHGELPALTWIGPREGVNKSLGPLGNPNSDHPACCDVRGAHAKLARRD